MSYEADPHRNSKGRNLSRWLAISALFLCACASKPVAVSDYQRVVEKPDTSQVETHVRSAVVHADAASDSLAKASTIAAKLPDTDDTKQLRAELLKANVELRQVKDELTNTQVANAALKSQVDASEHEKDLLIAKNNEQVKTIQNQQKTISDLNAEKAVLQSKLNEASRTKWGGWLACGGLALLVGGFFVARQYFPFLKLI